MARPLARDAGIQPYTALLYAAIEELGVTVEPYRTRHAVFRTPDVIHVHWPEHALASRGLGRVLRPVMVLAGLALARRRGARLVYTAHNVVPHDLELTRFSRWFLSTFDSMVDTVLVLTRAGGATVLAERPHLHRASVVHTRHGHFRDAYPPTPDAAAARRAFGLDPTRPTLAFVGQVRPYKGVPDLVDAARDLDAHVLVAGRCDDPDLREQLQHLASSNPRLILRLEALSPEALVLAVAAANVVVLPYRTVLNSGPALLALSLGRAVLVPDTPTFREIAEEVGPSWVIRYRGDRVSSGDLTAALRADPKGTPDLHRYEWHEVAAATVAGYRAALAAR